MPRFFVPRQMLMQKELWLDEENAAHARVLRLKAGDEIVLCDGDGLEAFCTLISSDKGYLVSVKEVYPSESEARVKVSVYMALPKADKLEHVIQKATELGAYEIITFPTARCVSRPDEKSLRKKLERWQKIAASAAEQCGRGRIPQIIILDSYKEALLRASKTDLPILFYENEHSCTLHQALRAGDYASISLLSGPEGGFGGSEILQAQEAGIKICTLGKRILRCETAPLCALSAVMYHTGEF